MDISLSQAIEGYELAAHARRLSKRTLEDYGNTFAKLQTFLKDDPPISAIRTDELRRFLSAQSGVTRKTLLNYHTGLSALWRWAAGDGLIEKNIVREIEPPRPEMRGTEPNGTLMVSSITPESSLGPCDAGCYTGMLQERGENSSRLRQPWPCRPRSDEPLTFIPSSGDMV